ncbi:MAG: L,D-transpeptidase family protein [Clostridia bacterium]|nr:L,D-transpeptidase family protein [Clostridia bacterium]
MAKKHRRKRRGGPGRMLLTALVGLILLVAIALGFGMASGRDTAAVQPSATPLEPTVTEVPTPTPVPATAVPMATVEPFYTIAPTPEPERVDYEYPYLIEVNYKAQLVRIYTLDENGMYSTVVKNMLTSSGKTRICPTGLYKLHDKRRWITFLDGSYGQYSCRITGHFLFHSLPYSKYNDNSTLITKDYGELGQNTSGGCMRLMCKDAKWIYDNCPEGTPVIITDGEEVDPSIYESIVQPPLVSGDWDPTDPDPDNPDYFDESDATPPPTCNPYVTPSPFQF